jgi:hypothetical protein
MIGASRAPLGRKKKDVSNICLKHAKRKKECCLAPKRKTRPREEKNETGSRHNLMSIVVVFSGLCMCVCVSLCTSTTSSHNHLCTSTTHHQLQFVSTATSSWGPSNNLLHRYPPCFPLHFVASFPLFQTTLVDCVVSTFEDFRHLHLSCALRSLTILTSSFFDYFGALRSAQNSHLLDSLHK